MTSLPVRCFARPLLAGAVAVAHVAVVALIIAGGSRAAPIRAGPAIMVHEVLLPAPVAAPAIVTIFAPIDPGLAPPKIEIAAEPGSGDACPLTGVIAAALANDRDVAAVLAATPATAVMIWDGAWSSDAAVPVRPIRRVVIERVRAASAVCRDTAMTGPRLILVPSGANNVAVAIGSGKWYWRQLLI